MTKTETITQGSSVFQRIEDDRGNKKWYQKEENRGFIGVYLDIGNYMEIEYQRRKINKLEHERQTTG